MVEIGFHDRENKTGRYALRLFPEVRSLDPPEGARNGEGTTVEGGDGDPMLTDEALFCEFDEKAPRQGLERGAQTPGNTALSGVGGAISGAVVARAAEFPPELGEVVAAWPALDEAARAAVLEIVRARLGGQAPA